MDKLSLSSSGDSSDRDARDDDVHRAFQEVLSSLSADPSLDSRFAKEYERLLDALSASHTNERALLLRVRDLSSELLVSASTVANGLALAEEDAQTITELKTQLERSLTDLNAASAREGAAVASGERAQARKRELEDELARHRELLGEDASIESLLAQRNILEAKVQSAEEATEAEKLRSDELAAEIDVRKRRLTSKREELRAAQRQLAEAGSNAVRDSKRALSFEDEIARLQKQLTGHDATIVHLREQLELSQTRTDALDKQLAVQRSANAASAGELLAVRNSVRTLDECLGEASERLTRVMEERNAFQRELRDTTGELSAEKTRCRAALTACEVEKKEKTRLRTLLDSSNFEVVKLAEQIAAVHKELDVEVAAIKDRERAIQQQEIEKASLSKRLLSETQKASDTRVELGERAAEASRLESECRRATLEVLRLRSEVTTLERDRGRLRTQAEKADSAAKETQEEVKLLEQQLIDMERREEDAQRRIKEQQSSYGTLRTEKNVVSKQLMDTQDSVGELTRKTKVQINQIEQLKDEGHLKDRALVAEQFERRTTEKKLDARQHEVEAFKRLLDDASSAASRQASEVKALQATIRRLDAEALVQKRAYDALVTERDILSAQLVRRNDELQALYTKADTQASLLTAGEKQYQKRLEEVRLLMTVVTDLKRKLELMEAAQVPTMTLRTEVARLQKDLMQEQTKVKALSDELETPMNIHRWRRLEGTDPSAFELSLKARTLQKRLIAKTEEAVEAATRASDAEAALAAVREQLARQPGSEWTDQFTQLHHLLNERTRQVKALASEANMAQTMLSEKTFELERTARELHSVKKAFFSLKEQLRVGGSDGGTSLNLPGRDTSTTTRPRLQENVVECEPSKQTARQGEPSLPSHSSRAGLESSSRRSRSTAAGRRRRTSSTTLSEGLSAAAAGDGSLPGSTRDHVADLSLSMSGRPLVAVATSNPSTPRDAGLGVQGAAR